MPQNRQGSRAFAADGPQQTEVRVRYFKIADDTFPESALREQVSEETMSDAVFARKFLGFKRKTLGDGESSFGEPVRIVPETYVAEGILSQVAYKPLPVPYA